MARLIFTVTTGRSGTGYLASLLSVLPGVTALHEPAPYFSDVMRAAQTNKEHAKAFLMKKKMPAINKYKCATYIETSHLFCKGFFEPILSFGITPDLILLTRDKTKVAKSLLRLHTVPGRSSEGRRWYVGPEDPQNLTHIENSGKFNNYQICYWYCLEIEARMKKYSKVVSDAGGLAAKIDLDELKDLSKFNSFLKLLNLPEISGKLKDKYIARMGKVVNAKLKKWMPKVKYPDNIPELERQVVAATINK